MKRMSFVVVVVALAACGGKPKTASVEHTDPMHHMNEGEHPAMTPAIDAFHEQLSPLWHAEAGPQRTADTCAAVPGMDEKLVAAENEAAPAAVDAALWSQRLGELRTQWGLLAADCLENQAADFTARFTDAHNAFHALIELVPMVNK